MRVFKSQEQLIAEIHNEFDTAQERLLVQANELLKLSSIRDGDISVESTGERLKKLGFVNTPVAKEAQVIRKKNEEKLKVYVKTSEQARLIQYYKMTYPFLKFLTEEELDRICVKYNLVHAPVGNYIKDVPVKNVNDIEQAQPLKPSDLYEPYRVITITKFFSGADELKDFLKGKEIRHYGNKIYVDLYGEAWPSESLVKKEIVRMGFKGTMPQYTFRSAKVTTIDRSGLFIAAPASHFNMEGLKKGSKHGYFNVFEREIKDPIVFRYVRGGIQVITKWGLEASDPALVVDKLN